MARSSSRIAAATQQGNDEAGESSGRRSTRTRQQTTFFSNGKDNADNDDSNDEASSEEEENPSSEEEEEEESEEEEEEVVPAKRKSSRSTAFRGDMKDPSNSIADLLKNDAPVQAKKRRAARHKKRSSLEASVDSDDDDDEDDDDDDSSVEVPRRKTSKRRAVKSPAKRHSSRRMTKKLEYAESDSSHESDYESEVDDDEDDSKKKEKEEDEPKINKIIAARSMTLAEWKKVCSTMTTSEVTYGSVWDQEETDRDPGKYEERFLVKWEGLSFLHCSWETEKDLIELCEGAKTRMSTFFRKAENGLLYDADERLDGDYFDPSWVTIERILDVSEETCDVEEGFDDDPIKKYNIVLDVNHPDFEKGTGRQIQVKWVNKPYSEGCYEFERDLILSEVEYLDELADFQRRSVKPTEDDMKQLAKKGKEEKKKLYKTFRNKVANKNREQDIQKYQKELENHVFKNGGQLRDYQAEGVSWLMANHANDRSSILADEMGLGKTIQTATYVNQVAKQLSTRGPFLIIAPLSTIPHWYREFTGWTDLNTIVYHGSANDRERAREDEFVFPVDHVGNVGIRERYLKKVQKHWQEDWERTWMVEVVITTPEMLVTEDFRELAAINWEILVVDEAHRLKNHRSKLAVNLREEQFKFNRTLLLTGTPIQNNMEELWTLLNFIDSENFEDMDEFMDKYGDIKSKERVDELHETIRPYILRRLKEDVEKSVPPKEETLIEVELTVVQKQYYRALYEKNVKFLHKNKKGGVDGPSLNNLAMQLRKCCNHPFLLNGIEEEIRNQQPNADIADLLVNTSGKFVLLDKLLPRLKEEGHRILLFSQFKIMLDIIEDYLHHREFKCERIDGSITGLKRQAAIDRFQSKDSKGRDEPFIMLLSTRAGGVGINLTAADTCIIFDSDWNPQNDLQAQARCHRIGQTKEVKIYRLLTRKTYEMQMFHMSSMKMGLDQAVLQGIEGGNEKDIMTKEEVERLLKHGAYDIFREDKDGSSEKESTDFVSQDIDSILARRAKTVVHENTGSKSNAAGGTFSKASFKSTNDGGADAAGIDVDDPDFWTKVVGEAKEETKVDDLAGKKRKRSEKSYNEREYHKKLDAVFKGTGSFSDMEGDDANDDASVASEYSDSGDETLASVFSEDLRAIAKATKSHKKEERHRWGGSGAKEWKNSDADHVLKALNSFGYGNIAWEKFQSQLASQLSKPMHLDEIKRMSWALALVCLQEAAEDDALEKKRKEEAHKKDKPTAGGVLGQAAGASEDTNEVENDGAQAQEDKSASEPVEKDLAEESFQAFLSENESWVMKALADASAYSKVATSRDKEWVQRIIDGTHNHKTGDKENPVQLKLSAEFNDNVWPALRTRGWKEESGKARRKGYVYKGKTLKSISAVLDAVPRFHPELANMVSSLISTVSATCKQNEDPHPVSSIDMDKMTLKSLRSFLMDCAPLQLLVDRKAGNRLTLNKRTLSQLKYCHSLHEMIASADSNLSSEASIEVRNDMLAKLIKVHPKVSRPHPDWTPTHDAILIRASAKHGWPDKSSSAMAIANDKSIKWGAPFEATEKAKEEEKQDEADAEAEEKSKEEFEQLFAVASRAAAFLNPLSANFSDAIPAADLNEIRERLITSYALRKDSAEEEESSNDREWKVKEKKLQALLKPKKNKKEADCEELPPRKKLLKRARKIVLSFMGKDSGVEEDKEDAVSAKQEEDVSANHGFCVLDQKDRNNILLVEMIRGQLKLKQGTKSQKMKDYTALVFDELDQRLKILRSSNGNEAQIQELEKIRKNFQLYVDNSRKSPRAAKNVLRVMLGKDPVQPKAATDTVFPAEKVEKAEKAAQTKQKKKKGIFTPADAALNRALASLKDDNGDDLADCILLTSTEILMLTVLSSQGIPVFNTGNWASLVSNELTTIEDDFQIYFFAMAGIMEAAAGVWLNIAEKKLQSKVDIFKNSSEMSDTAKSKLTHEISVLQKDFEAKSATKEEAIMYSNDPLLFAKRAIMLLEALRKHMGPVDTNYAGEKKIRALNKSENGLGTKVISWMSKEMQRWAEPLQVLDNAGNVISKTSITPAKDHSQSYDAAIMTKRDCRTVFIQIAQQTRLRSIFIKNDIMKLQSDLVPKVLKQSSFTNTEWAERPSWWNSDREEVHCSCQDDLDLLVGILDFGYGGFDSLVEHDYSFCSKLSEEPAEVSKAFTRAAVQCRVNHLTRELHAIDDSAEMMKLVRKKEAKRKSGEVVDGSSANVVPKKKKTGTVQSGLKAFFSKKPFSAPSSKKQKTPPTSPEPTQDDSDVEVIAVKKQKC